ncbi:MAG: UDP-glucose 4-epimerase [Candidatus Latescibacterota bacterium]|jgi:UDP-glucose 4-epimerase
MTDAVLITGGAGYIGSHTARRLLEDNRRVVVLDDLSTGHREVLTLFERVYGPDQFCFENVNLLDTEALAAVFDRHEFLGIVDFAAKSLVGESQEKPRFYFENNVIAFRNLVVASGDLPIVKSSTAATYGEPRAEHIPLDEGYQDYILGAGEFDQSQLMPAAVNFDTVLEWYKKEVAEQNPSLALLGGDIAHLKIPTNVYGITKVMDERLLVRSQRRFAALRYFNAAGADRSRLIGEDHDPETHLIPIVLQVALGQRPHITVFGEDYETPDGTAVRDYVSVPELAEAHVLCLDKLIAGAPSMTYNLGSSKGYSVRGIIEAAREVTGHAIPEVVGDRRSGDPATLIADAEKIHQELGWCPRESLLETLESAWHWHRLHPQGYQVVQEERFNPFWNRWVNIAAHRGNRPWSGETQTMETGEEVAYDPECYLCPGNTRVTGDVNPQYEDVWTFANDFSSLVLDAYDASAQKGPYISRTSRGVCEVVVYGPNHSQRLSTLSVDEIANVVDAWAEIYARLGKIPEIVYPLIFENRGTVMGNSQPHPHGQVYAYGEIPDLIVKPQLAMFAQHQKDHGGCFVCDANAVEVDDGRRILFDHDDVVVYVPYAAQFPYDVMIVPKRHVPSLLALRVDERRGVAEVLQHVLVGLDGLFGASYHYTLALLQAPTDGVDYRYHMQIHITSLLRGPGLRKHVVGADIFGNLINPSDPDVTAEELRHAMRNG